MRELQVGDTVLVVMATIDTEAEGKIKKVVKVDGKGYYLEGCATPWKRGGFGLKLIRKAGMKYRVGQKFKNDNLILKIMQIDNGFYHGLLEEDEEILHFTEKEIDAYTEIIEPKRDLEVAAAIKVLNNNRVKLTVKDGKIVGV